MDQHFHFFQIQQLNREEIWLAAMADDQQPGSLQLRQQSRPEFESELAVEDHSQPLPAPQREETQVTAKAHLASSTLIEPVKQTK